MRKSACLLLFFFLVNTCFPQDCPALIADTMTLPGEHKALNGEYLEAQMKNGSTIRFFKTENEHIYLRIVVTKNFYFNQVSTLEIKSGSKSYYIKNAKQYKLDKVHGLYVAEIYSNYLNTLKELGITAIDFGGVVTDFTKHDASEVKNAAGCVYNTLSQKGVK
jgi:hypothetical protein